MEDMLATIFVKFVLNDNVAAAAAGGGGGVVLPLGAALIESGKLMNYFFQGLESLVRFSCRLSELLLLHAYILANGS